MNPDGVPEIVEEMPGSINGAGRGPADQDTPAPAPAHAPAPAAQQKGKTRDWVVEINYRLRKQYADATKLLRAPTQNNDYEPLIFLTGRPPKKFYIGYLLRHDQNQSDMWEYAAFVTEKLGLDVNECLEFMEKNEKLVRNYYDDEYQACLIKESPQFLESLLVASCFQCLVFLIMQDGFKITPELYSIYSDPMFDRLAQQILKEGSQTQLDMLNLENQIPWFITEAVFGCSILSNASFEHTNRKGEGIKYLAITAFDNLYPRANKSKVTNPTFPKQGFRHLLDLFHWTRSPSELKFMGKIPLDCPKRFRDFFIPNAIELLGSATVFQKLDGASGCDVKFSKKTIRAVMQLGPLHLFPYSYELYGHLITFEHKSIAYYYGYPVTAHFACMKSLLQTKEDVKLLQKNGIVQNILQGEKDVLNFVHGMGEFVVEELNAIIPDELDELSKKVIEHHERRASRAYTEIKNQFCPSKWVIISIIAGIMLFVLTFIQTIYTGLGYYKT